MHVRFMACQGLGSDVIRKSIESDHPRAPFRCQANGRYF